MLRRISAACALALGLTACGFEVEQKSPPVNPNPTDAYRFEVWVEDPPRPMRVASMTAWYGTEHCLPRQPISGVYAVNANFPVPLRPEVQGDNRYTATVFADLLLPSDLYGEGVCLWRLSNVETIWSDGTLWYRQIGRVTPFSDGIAPDEFTVFSRSSKASPDPRAIDPLPMAEPLHFGVYEGEFPVRVVRDPSLERIVPPHKSGERELPRREIGPATDFLLRSRGQRVDSHAPVMD